MATRTQIGIATIAAALVIAVPFITPREGESLVSYQDVAGVWTICNGETYRVEKGIKLTREQCGALTQSRIGMFMLQITPLIQVPLSPNTLAAHTSMAYNVGIEGYGRSSTLRLTNMGKMRQGCEAMKLWYKAGGRDCRVRSSGCYGLWKRRLAEVDLCLSGLD